MNSISQLEQDELDGTTAASGTMLTDPSCPPKILLAPSAPSAWLQQGEGGSRRWGLVPNHRWDFCSPALGCPQPLLVPAWREIGGLAHGHSAHRRRAPGSLVWSPPPEPGPVLPCLLARMAVVWELRAGCGQAVGMAGVQRCGEPGSCMAACCELQSTTFSCTIGFEQGLMEGRTGGLIPWLGAQRTSPSPAVVVVEHGTAEARPWAAELHGLLHQHSSGCSESYAPAENTQPVR